MIDLECMLPVTCHVRLGMQQAFKDYDHAAMIWELKYADLLAATSSNVGKHDVS